MRTEKNLSFSYPYCFNIYDGRYIVGVSCLSYLLLLNHLAEEEGKGTTKTKWNSVLS